VLYLVQILETKKGNKGMKTYKAVGTHVTLEMLTGKRLTKGEAIVAQRKHIFDCKPLLTRMKPTKVSIENGKITYTTVYRD